MYKKKTFRFILFIIVELSLILTISCKKDEAISDPISTVVFNTIKTYGTMTDQDGNIYKTINIGTQTWIAENLRVTKYRNGDLIPNVTKNENWSNLITGAYCNYENSTDKGKITTYGRLYNWFTVADIRNLAPEGWHVPTDAEWSTLINFLGGDSVAGGKMKEIGTTHWDSPNTGATNESGFSATPAGARFDSGPFTDIGFGGYYWSTTLNSNTNAWIRNPITFNTKCYRSEAQKQTGFSVRLVKD